MKQASILCAGIIAAGLLLSCTGSDGSNPLDPTNFADQFKHVLTFDRGGATEPDSIIIGDEMDLVMFQLKVHVASPAEPVRIDALTFRASGTAHDREDITSVGLWRDRNNDGLLDGSDILLSTERPFTGDDGRVRFSNLGLVIDHDETRRFLLVYEMAGTASPGETLRIRLATNDDVVSEGDDSGCPVDVDGLPVRSPERRCGNANTGSIRAALGPANPPARVVGVSATGGEVLQVSLERDGSTDAIIAQITFHGSGTAHEQEDILQVTLYRDVNDNGSRDIGIDVLLGSGVYASDDGAVTISGMGEVLGPTQVTNLLLVYDLSGTGWKEETLQVGILTDLDVSATEMGTGSPLPVLGLPVMGEIFTLSLGN